MFNAGLFLLGIFSLSGMVFAVDEANYGSSITGMPPIHHLPSGDPRLYRSNTHTPFEISFVRKVLETANYIGWSNKLQDAEAKAKEVGEKALRTAPSGSAVIVRAYLPGVQQATVPVLGPTMFTPSPSIDVATVITGMAESKVDAIFASAKNALAPQGATLKMMVIYKEGQGFVAVPLTQDDVYLALDEKYRENQNKAEERRKEAEEKAKKIEVEREESEEKQREITKAREEAAQRTREANEAALRKQEYETSKARAMRCGTSLEASCMKAQIDYHDRLQALDVASRTASRRSWPLDKEQMERGAKAYFDCKEKFPDRSIMCGANPLYIAGPRVSNGGLSSGVEMSFPVRLSPLLEKTRDLDHGLVAPR
jgi:hypothetical protein